MCYPLTGFSLSLPKWYGGEIFVASDFLDLVNRLIDYFTWNFPWLDDNRGSGR